MLAMAGDELVLDDTSALGPIDPQLVYRDPQTGQSIVVPTQAIMEGFNNAKNAIKTDPDVLGLYLPLLSKLDLHLFEMCKNAEKLSKSLVKEWLKRYLLKGEKDAAAKAAKITRYLSSHKDRLSHGRPLTIETIKNELKISHILDLRTEPDLRDLITELWAEIEFFVEHTGTAKFFENAYGVAFRRTFQMQQQVIQLPISLPPQQPVPQSPASPQPAGPPPITQPPASA
jgi:hypothetical protein